MKRPQTSHPRQGMAIPVVILFVIIAFTFFTSMTISRQRVRKQNIVSFSQKQAYYMAMGGIQHALLKLRLLQRQGYDSACLTRGVCPFFNMVGSRLMGNFSSDQLPNKCNKAMDIFLADLRNPTSGNTNGIRFYISDPNLSANAMPWYYEVKNISVLSYHTSTTAGSDYGTIRISMGIEAQGYAYDRRNMDQYRSELVKKEVFIERKMR